MRYWDTSAPWGVALNLPPRGFQLDGVCSRVQSGRSSKVRRMTAVSPKQPPKNTKNLDIFLINAGMLSLHQNRIASRLTLMLGSHNGSS